MSQVGASQRDGSANAVGAQQFTGIGTTFTKTISVVGGTGAVSLAKQTGTGKTISITGQAGVVSVKKLLARALAITGVVGVPTVDLQATRTGIGEVAGQPGVVSVGRVFIPASTGTTYTKAPTVVGQPGVVKLSKVQSITKAITGGAGTVSLGLSAHIVTKFQAISIAGQTGVVSLGTHLRTTYTKTISIAGQTGATLLFRFADLAANGGGAIGRKVGGWLAGVGRMMGK